MYRWGIFSMVIFLSVLPLHIGAYSYGKPDEEPIADAYKTAAAALAATHPAYSVAEKALAAVRPEMEEHAEIGPDLTRAIQRALMEKKQDQALMYWREALVRNVERRLNNVEQDFNNYSSSKILLAKANATFSILALHLRQLNAPLVVKVNQAFEEALQSLGNPGLFGVGKKLSNVTEFKKSKQFIVSQLRTVYIPQNESIKSGEKGHIKVVNSGVQADVTASYAKWIPLAVIVGVLGLAIGVFFYLGRKK